MTTDILDLIALSPDRWRYPGLAAALAGGLRPGLDEAATLLLEGIARPRGLAESLAATIADGRYATAEALLLELLESPGVLGDEELERLDADLELSRSAAVAEVERAWAALNDRAAEAGLPRQDGQSVIELAGRDRALAQARLDERGQLIGDDLDDRLRQRLGDGDQGPDAGPWATAIEQSVRQGEFGVAASLLGGPAGRVLAENGPLTVPPVPWRWPWHRKRVADVLAWYTDRWTAPGEFAAYRPAAHDVAANRLVEALRAITLRIDEETVAEFGTAMAALLEGGAGDTFAVDEVPGHGVRIDFADGRVAAAEPFTRRMAVWVSDAAEAPGPAVGRPVVWFRPVMTAGAVEAPGVTTVDVSALLRLIAPFGPDRATDASIRRINLLRLLLPQLEPAAVLTPDLRLAGRDGLAWLLDVFGLTCDAAVLDALLAGFGVSPVALWCMVDGLIAAHRAAGRRQPIGLEQLSRVSLALRSQIRDAVFASLASDVLARAALWLILQQPTTDRPCTAATALDELHRQDALGRGADWMVNRESVAAALETLADHGLLVRAEVGAYRLPAPGLIAALLDPSGKTPAQRTRELLDEINQAVRERHDAMAAVLGPRVTHLIGHRVDNEVIGISGELTRALDEVTDPGVRDRLAKLQERIRALGGGAYLDLYWAALAPPGAVEVTDLIDRVIGNVEWRLPDGVGVTRPSGDSCWVTANPAIFEEALRNLVLNSARALAREPQAGQQAAIRVSVTTVAPAAPRPVPLSGPAVVIEVVDNGPGFPADELEHLRRVTDPAGLAWHPAATRGASGQGIPLTASMLREYKGALEIRNSDDPRLGGIVRVWLPRLTDPTAAGNPSPRPRPAPEDRAPAER